MPVCSIVIRAYNEEKHLGRLLAGLLQQTVQDVQMILVDSGSTDATLAIAARFPVQVVQIRPQDFTFGRSLNLGIAAANAPLVVMASAHVYPVYPDWLERLLEPLHDPQVALSYGKQRGAATTHFSEHQIFRHWFPERSVSRQAHPFCNNANAAIRRELWQQHPYDELLTGLEDLAWAGWAQKQGYAIAYVAEAEVIHVHQETWRGIYNRYRREGMGFKQIYTNETLRWGDFFPVCLSNAWNDLRAARRQGVFWQQAAAIVRFRYEQFRGTYHGYRQSGPLTWQLKQAFYYPRPLVDEAPQRALPPIDYSNLISPEKPHDA
jgi:glycosyltransferase involved in cell wall biosynthesis